jgi:hypothetical protein
MSTSSDLKVGEARRHRVLVIETATGNPWLLQNPLVTIIDESDNQAVAAAATEESNGYYHYDFTPDAAGTWTSSWALAGATFYHSPLIFKVGSTGLGTAYDAIVDLHDVPAQGAAANTNMRDVVGNKTDVATAAIFDNKSLVSYAKGIINHLGNFAGRANGDVTLLDVLGVPDVAGKDLYTCLVTDRLDTIVADTPYIADAALPAAPTAGSLGSRFTGMVVLETTIAADGRSTIGARLTAGSDNNNAYVGMLAVMDSDAGDFEYVSRTITAYTGATKQLTWSPAITEDAHQGGKIWIVASDTTLNPALAIIDGYHDLPVQNSANNSVIRDVVGNKTDTTAGDSLVALTKIVDGVVDAIKARTDHHLVTRTWFSASQEEVALTGGAGDKTLPSVTLPNITGTIVHVYAGFKFRMIENTNAAANKLNGAQDIQVRVDTPGAWADAINFVDDQFGLAASTREGGDCIIGNIDLVGTVTAFNDIYEFQWDEAVADQANLQFNDVQTFLIVSYY